MIKLRKRLEYLLLTAAFLISTVVLQFAYIEIASAASLTWDGSSNDGKFSTAANWSTNAVPVSGDIVTFPASAAATLVNDIPSVFLGGAILLPTANGSSGGTNYNIDILRFQDDATITRTVVGGTVLTPSFGALTHFIGSGDLIVSTNIQGQVTVAGDLTIGGTNTGNVSMSSGSVITGNIILGMSSGYEITANATAAGYIVGDHSRLNLGTVTNQSAPITLTGPGSRLNTRSDVTCGDQYCVDFSPRTYNISSPITLNEDAFFKIDVGITANFTGTIQYNGHTISKTDDSDGTLIINGQTITHEPRVTVLDGDESDTDVIVRQNEVATLNGTRDRVTAYANGIIKGTGHAIELTIAPSATLSPGNSPGTITADLLAIMGTYQAEILNKDSYDKVIAGEGYTDDEAAIVLTSTAVLQTQLYDGWVVNQGDQFMIIENRSGLPVYGTFSGLAEGAQFTVDGITFNITYVGGDGDDVVLTALNAGTDPTPPNTGAAQVLLANPALLAGLGIVTAGIFLAIAMRRRTVR